MERRGIETRGREEYGGGRKGRVGRLLAHVHMYTYNVICAWIRKERGKWDREGRKELGREGRVRGRSGMGEKEKSRKKGVRRREQKR